MRYYSSSAVETALTSPINSSATSITLDSVSGMPLQTPYTLSIDADNASKELVEVTAASGATLTVTRGVDGTSATSHSLGAKVSHDHSARDFRDSREHEAASTGVHGATGSVVGTTDTQTLTNKDLSASSNTFPVFLAANLPSDTVYEDDEQTLTNKDLSDETNTFPDSLVTLDGTQTLENKTLDDETVFPSTVVKTTSSQTLTNKNLTSDTNSFPTSLVTLTDAQTLTNKTLTAPTVTDPSIKRGTISAKVPYTATTESGLPSAVRGELAVTDDGKLWLAETNNVWIDVQSQPHIVRWCNSAQSIATGGSNKKITTFGNVVDTPRSRAGQPDVIYSGGTFTVSEAGVYIIDLSVGFAAQSNGADGTRQLFINAAGGTFGYNLAIPASGIPTRFGRTITKYLSAGVDVEFYVYQSSGETLTLETGYYTSASITRVSR